MPPLSIMIKPSSSLCNLRCKYCFYSDVSSQREETSFGIMNASTAENLLKNALSFADGENISFTFQGGEPLLAGKKFYKNFVETAKSLNRKNSKIFYSIQTNGTLIDDEWARFFKQNGFLVGLSLDGDFEGNKFRVDANSSNVYYKVIHAANKLKKHSVEFNILIVLTGYCADNCERIYKFFRDNGFRYLQFIPCLRPFGDKSESEMYMTVKQYENFLVKTFRLYAEDYAKGRYVSVRYFDNLVRMYLGMRPEQCGLCGYCSRQFVCESGGNIYPCDFYCTDEWLLGNINDELLSVIAQNEKAKQFFQESLAVSEKCKKCRFFSLCRAQGCKRNRQDRDYCLAYMNFFAQCQNLFPLFKR